MPAVPQPNHQTRALIFESYEKEARQEHRPHLGASLIGRECERMIWYTHRWCDTPKFDGRMLRLFDTGNLEEPRLVADLRRIGAEVYEVDPDTGKQWQVWAHGGHFGGSMDATARGLPEAPKTWHVLEFKTSNSKVFKAMVKDGVRLTKPEHFAQMQVYMGITKMTRAMYIMKNKEDDDLHVERIEFDPSFFAALMAKAERILRSSTPPLRLHDDATRYPCRFCTFVDVCHGTKAPEVSCRSCAHATPELDGDARWSCARAGADSSIPVEFQRTACDGHRFIPALLERFAKPVDTDGDNVVYETAGRRWTNGEGANAISSREVYACERKEILPEHALLKAELLEQGLKSTVVA